MGTTLSSHVQAIQSLTYIFTTLSFLASRFLASSVFYKTCFHYESPKFFKDTPQLYPNLRNVHTCTWFIDHGIWKATNYHNISTFLALSYPLENQFLSPDGSITALLTRHDSFGWSSIVTAWSAVSMV